MNTADNYTLAQNLVALGYIPVAMRSGTKIPAESEWQEWPNRQITEESIARRWKGTRHGVALLCHGIVVLDVDQADLLDFVLKQTKLEDAPICRSPRGGYHVHARARKGMQLSRKIKVRNRCIDLLTGPSLSILPPHRTSDGAYTWLSDGLPPAAELPIASLAWTRERRRTKKVVQRVEINEADEAVRRARGYLAKVEGAVSGQGGHSATFRAACILVHRFRLSIEQAWPLFLEWNTKCEPPWNEHDLMRKLTEAQKHGHA
jgi:hypothetical protein